MHCDNVYGPGNVVVGKVCFGGRRGGGPPGRCRCGAIGVYECDGPPPPDRQNRKGATCDRPICAGCAVSIRYHNLDFCPECATAVPPLIGCLNGPPFAGTRLTCVGALVGKLSLCVRHAVLHDHWLGFAGGSAVYARKDLDREAKREAHRDWIRATNEREIMDILEARHARS